VAAVARPWPGPDPRWPAPEVLPWPGADLPGPRVAPGASCALTTGDAAVAVLAAGRTATVATQWTTSDGRVWQVLLRPLLPSEHGCADLATG
jgi:hypothetical protein